MNFQDLLEKIKTIDEAGQGVMAPPSKPEMPECGDGPMEPSKASKDNTLLTDEGCGPTMSMGAPKQSDSVTMNVSMNGSGSGGIKDLLDILRNLDQPGAGDHDDILVGMEKESFGDTDTRPHPETAELGAVIPTGDDMFSKGKEAPKVNGGGNPMHEALVAKLAEKYQSIKNS